MRFAVPHPIPYQGSKRRLASAILSYIPADRYRRLVEPFAGSAAVTLAAASRQLFSRYLLGDALEPLARLWSLAVETPAALADAYENMWERGKQRPLEAFYEIRAEFNIDRDPAKLLYLLARCVKNAVRFNPAGEFNQSPDRRRTGKLPGTLRGELQGAHRALTGRCAVVAGDFSALIEAAREGDFFYLDPPYQGTSGGRDPRYFSSVSRDRIVDALETLNRKRVPFLLSYDGSCGDRSYGAALPARIARRILLDAGRSSQATLNGRAERTVESLYVSRQFSL
ncbi:MAG TPA: DNA adenine methylase [Bryobacteraceae bacterium]|nr:DNA adenine methylase [Bryobacteraceae bacterium]